MKIQADIAGKYTCIAPSIEGNIDFESRSVTADEGFFIAYRTIKNAFKAREKAIYPWRIEKDWLEAQFAKIEAMRMPLEQLMLPYLVTQNGTVYDSMVRHYKALPAPQEPT